MKKTTKIALLLAAGLLAAGLALCGTALALADFDLGRLSTDYGTAQRTGHTVDPAEVSRIELNIREDDLVVTPSEDGQIHIEYVQRERLRYQFRQADGVVAVEQAREGRWTWFTLQLGLRTNQVVVSLPEDWAGDLRVESDVGAVTLERPLHLGALDIRVGTGDLDLRGLRAGSVTAQSDVGCIYGAGWDVERYAFLETDTGDITLEDSDAGIRLQCQTDVGGLRLERVTAEELEAESATGDVTLRQLAADRIRITSDVGAIRGDIDGAEADYTISAEADVGDCNLRDWPGRTDKTLTLETDVGDIDIRFNR